MKKYTFLFIISLTGYISFGQRSVGQRSVAITIDDVPNVRLYKSDGYSSGLLKKLDSLHLPVAIFINEGNLKQTEEAAKNKELLKKWILKDYITAGNHSYSHQNYGETGFDTFKEDVLKGEEITKAILKGSGKTLKYFRFPFNSMGKDSLAHQKILKFLSVKNYISTPFTIESEDWLYAELYDKALKDGDGKYAQFVGSQYVEMTLKIFNYFDSLSVKIYGRPIKQIYLCHDSKLNTDYLSEIIQKLKERNYRFVSIADAMKDTVYQSKDYYQGNNGISWMYRWVEDPKKRLDLMRAEPDNPPIRKAFEEMNKEK